MPSSDKNYTLGKLGVVVDKSPVHADPSELLKAQNAVRDPLGVDGGLVKRPALGKLNSSAAAGSISGGISMPVFNFADTRTLYLAQFNSSAAAWVSTSNLFVASAVTTALAIWKDPTAYYTLAANVARMGAVFGGRLYYAGADYTPGTTSPTIRVFNGSEDKELCKILPATTKGVTGFFAQKGSLYVLTLDSGTTDADFVGSIYKLESNGHLTKQGDSLPTGYVPTALIVYNDKIYVGASRLTTTNEARVYWLDPLSSTTAWTADVTLDADDYQVTGFASFKGLLYLTTKNGGGATKGKIRQRSLAGSWSTVDSTVNNTGSYEDIIAWEGYLYASSRNYDATTNLATIRRSSDGSSWATVANAATPGTGFGIFTIIGLRLFSMGLVGLQHTLNGTSWTSATPAGDGNVDGVLGVLQLTEVQEWNDPVGNPPPTTVNVTNVSTTGLASSDLPTGALAFVTKTLTIEEWRALNTVPKEMVATPGAGKMIFPWLYVWEQNATSTAYGSPTINLQYAGIATNLMSSGGYVESVYNVIGVYALGSSIGTGVSRANKALNFIRSGGTLTSGTWASDARITVWYSILDAV